MKTVLYLARHGETLWNKTQRLQGQLDSELTPLGKTQSLEITNNLSGKNIDLIISSPLGRAMQSAVICQQKLNVTHLISENLMERNLGSWQGQEVKNLKLLPEYNEVLNQVTALQAYSAEVKAESAIACGQRILETLKQLALKHTGKNMLIIFHGEALRCLLFLLGKKDINNAYNLYKNGCVVTVDFQPAAPYFTIAEE